MRVFICSTAYDLGDARDLCAEALRAEGHEPVHHENLSFPQQQGVHSHDRCILAVRSCDALACIVDRRYGGMYRGQLRADTPTQRVTSGRSTLEVGSSELSITWMEALEARALGLPVMTFARQKTLDELEIRKRNLRLKSLKLVHVEKKQQRLFDFLTWTTHQVRDNWIEKFVTLTELRDRMVAWVKALSVSTVTPAPGPPTVEPAAPVASLVVFVEGGFDGLVVQRLVETLQLPIRLDVVPVGGKARVLGNLRTTAPAYLRRYDAVLFLADADTDDEAAAAAELARVRSMVVDLMPELASRVHVQLAVPHTGAWVAVLGEGLDVSAELDPRSLQFVQIWRTHTLTEDQVARAMQRNSSLRDFVALVRTVVGQAPGMSASVDEMKTILLRMAKEAIAQGRERSAAATLEVELELESDVEVNAALALEAEGRGQVHQRDGNWYFRYIETDAIVEHLRR